MEEPTLDADLVLSSHELRTLFDGELPIIDQRIVYQTGPAAGPLIVVDASKRPDVVDLVRVIKRVSPGVATMQCSWRPLFLRPSAWLQLNVEITTPAVCSLRIVFRLPGQSELADEIAAMGWFSLSPYGFEADGSVDPEKTILVTCPDPTEAVRRTLDRVDAWGPGPESV